MATVKGVNKTLIDAGGSGSNVIPLGEFAGTIKSVYDTYVTAAATSGDLIEIATPPVGSKIVGITVAWTASSASTTLALGDGGDGTTAVPARYMAATDVGAAAGGVSLITVGGMNYKIGTASADNEMYLTLAGADIATATTIKTEVFYV